jgi:hypothetical protein
LVFNFRSLGLEQSNTAQNQSGKPKQFLVIINLFSYDGQRTLWGHKTKKIVIIAKTDLPKSLVLILTGRFWPVVVARSALFGGGC